MALRLIYQMMTKLLSWMVLHALTEGLRSAFLTATVFAGLRLLAWLLPAKHTAAQHYDRSGEPTA